MKLKVVFITSHPIQYQVPVFRHLAAMQDLDFQVFFAMIPGAAEQGVGFNVPFEWDVPLLEGYRYSILKNESRSPSVTRHAGCDTPGVRDAIAQADPDAVVLNGWVVKTCLQALRACKRLGIPCLVRGEANDLQRRPAWKRRLQGLLVRQFAGCLYIGSANRKFYLQRGVPESHLFFSPYCVDNERFINSEANSQVCRDHLRARWSIPPDSICYMFCGKFERKKHPLELLEALCLARRECPEIYLLMVGDGDLREGCEQFAAEKKLPVTFAGFLNQSEIDGAYHAVDCLVLPSDAGETWGLVVNEAMACGRPALVSNLVGCGADLVEESRTGNIYHHGQPAELAELMVRYGRQPEKLRDMGLAARERVQNYSPHAAAKGIQKGVQSVLGASSLVAT